MGWTIRLFELLNLYSWPGNVRELMNVHRICLRALSGREDYEGAPSHSIWRKKDFSTAGHSKSDLSPVNRGR